MNPVAPKRCAAYARVSSDERLDQSFNSIDAQREAGVAYIASQRAEGWIVAGDDYLDPGYSGGNMDRPGLKRLMADIEAGRIDIVVVYKIDRLTRSLADFARLIEVFERRRVSFVSVTQQFNTTTSMGRLMLNILLSFAQFEREVTGERIRDKIAASKAKGMWMGGVVPLGYRVEARRLIVEPAEAETVRTIFARFAQCRSTTELVRWLTSKGITSRSGTPFSKQALWKLLNNRIYLGEIVHRGQAHPGQHEAIIDRAAWAAVQAVFAVNDDERRRATRGRRSPAFLLAGLVVTDQGERMQPSFTKKGRGQYYRYYVPQSVQAFGAKRGHPIGRLAAEPLEELVLAQIYAALQAPERIQGVWDAVRAHGAGLTEPEVVLPMLHNFAAIWQALYPAEQQRITRLLIESVVVSQEAVSIVWRDAGWAELAREMRPDGIGAELRELEAEGAAA
ncbi:recombinase family protein [Benzoatithermus flavus]|uniref:Recombinase family protein n=1 Tax=Benzoatithermus flavus TaxID=3108223 RepID=A0ABU8Y077_9PROT